MIKIPTVSTEKYSLHQGDNYETLKTYPDNYFDSIVQDPPYGIEFLGKDWDKHTGTLELYKECLRVLKPGGYMLAFSAARTYHQLASNIELAGFEIRDQLMWLYASGFPKAQDIGKAIQKRLGVEEFEKIVDTTLNAGFGQTDHARVRAGVEWSTPATEVGIAKCTSPEAQEWEGWKTALKPAHEPIVMARKPIKSSVIDNVLKNGLGALNIDATRVPWADAADAEFVNDHTESYKNHFKDEVGTLIFQGTEKKKKSDTYALLKDKPIPESKDFPKEQFDGKLGLKKVMQPQEHMSADGRYPSNVIGEVEEGYQKYFYCPKVSRAERHTGFEVENLPSIGGIENTPPSAMERMSHSMARLEDRSVLSNKALAEGQVQESAIGNNHPTVKPVALMDYLIKLVTPPSTKTLQRKVLDPFMGSGSTGMAAVALGHYFVGCELDPKYVLISQTRIDDWTKPEEPINNFAELFDTQ